jgi:hypothetical protein
MRRVHVLLSFLLRLMALPDASSIARYKGTGVPRIIESEGKGRIGFCYFLACIEIARTEKALYLGNGSLQAS